MGEREITQYETVEKTETVKVCDSCGSDETELPDDSGDFRTIFENVSARADPHDPGYIRRERVGEPFTERGSVEVYIYGDTKDLCPICYGAVLGHE